MLTNTQVTRRPIPHEPGQWVETRLLGWHQLDEAMEVRRSAAFKTMRELAAAGAGLGRAVASADRDGVASAARALEADPSREYDALTVLRYGVVAWSYEPPVTEQALKDLDPVTKGWLVRAILRLEDPDERLFGSGPSTAG